ILLKTSFTHHWIGKAIIITLSFVIFGFLLRRKESIGNFSNDKVAWYSVLGSLAIMLLFYIIEFFR
ncbi:MAG: hypothetical protein ACE5KE_05310, partial [Methanosarcinales archaeon]